MKLSEILKDWPKKSDMDLSWLGGEKKEIAEIQTQQLCWNVALTSCDREIDREALASILYLAKCDPDSLSLTDSDKVMIMEESYRESDRIISTMPTWLKRIEK